MIPRKTDAVRNSDQKQEQRGDEVSEFYRRAEVDYIEQVQVEQEMEPDHQDDRDPSQEIYFPEPLVFFHEKPLSKISLFNRNLCPQARSLRILAFQELLQLVHESCMFLLHFDC